MKTRKLSKRSGRTYSNLIAAVESLECRKLLSGLNFAAVTSYPLATAGNTITGSNFAIADFNGDGFSDAAGTSISQLSVAVGKGDGSFQPPRSVFSGALPQNFLLAANIRGGTHLAADIITGGNVPGGGNGLEVFLNNSSNGTLSFASEGVIYTPNYTPQSAAVGDFNGDGKADLVVENETSTGNYQVTLLLGNGLGSFTLRSLTTASSYPYSIAVGEFFTGSTNLDIAIASSNPISPIVTIFPGNGDGTFGATNTFTASFAPTATATYDINNDGKADLILSNGSSEKIGIAIGNGSGHFTPTQTVTTSNAFSSLTAADLNGDAKTDIVVTGELVLQRDAPALTRSTAPPASI